MTLQDICQFRYDVVDLAHERSTDPLPDIHGVTRLVAEFCVTLERELE